ncbi:hypothetical protein GQX74_014431 [Glossina fuscipes]|nr:hypothetical protein GQX74_014431 [Glossina fuscipes]
MGSIAYRQGKYCCTTKLVVELIALFVILFHQNHALPNNNPNAAASNNNANQRQQQGQQNVNDKSQGGVGPQQNAPQPNANNLQQGAGGPNVVGGSVGSAEVLANIVDRNLELTIKLTIVPGDQEILFNINTSRSLSGPPHNCFCSKSSLRILWQYVTDSAKFCKSYMLVV